MLFKLKEIRFSLIMTFSTLSKVADKCFLHAPHIHITIISNWMHSSVINVIFSLTIQNEHLKKKITRHRKLLPASCYLIKRRLFIHAVFFALCLIHFFIFIHYARAVCAYHLPLNHHRCVRLGEKNWMKVDFFYLNFLKSCLSYKPIEIIRCIN